MTSTTIAGEGLLLRPWSFDDVERMVALFDDPDVAHRTPLTSPFDATAATRYVERAHAFAATRLRLAITADGQEPFGEVMLDLSSAVAGYMVGAGFRGRGLATRALRVITVYAHDVASLPAVSLHVEPDNAASIGVARSAGYLLSDVPQHRVQNKGRWCLLDTWVHRT